jgi:cytochrome c
MQAARRVDVRPLPADRERRLMGNGMPPTRPVAASPAWRVAALLACAAAAACSEAPAPDAAYRRVERADAERGLRLVTQYQCSTCHAIPGAASSSPPIGPPLSAFGGRSYIAGRVPNGPDALQRWLQSPQALVPETTMPDVGVSPEDARDIAAYLLSLP